jgi:hypothetical protein
MKINEIIVESHDIADPKKLDHDHASALKGPVSVPAISMNKSDGSMYKQYRFGLALAVADGKKGGKMEKNGAFAGDPLLITYTDEDFDMIKDAADMTDAGPINQLSRNKSEEGPETHKVSPVPQNSGVMKKKKK